MKNMKRFFHNSFSIFHHRFSMIYNLFLVLRFRLSVLRSLFFVLRLPFTVHCLRFICLLLLVIGLWSSSAFAQQDDIDLFTQGNTAYEQGDYEIAIAHYEESLESGKVSGVLYYNLANAYFKRNELGLAVLNYARSAEFIPRDADLNANYRHALSLVKRIEGQFRINYFTDHFQVYTVNELSWLLLILFASLVIAHLCSLYFSWRIKRSCFLIGSLFILIVFYAIGFGMKVLDLKSRAVVLEDVSVRFEPRNETTIHFSSFEGNFVHIVKVENEWMKILRFDGKTGWVKSDMIKWVKSENGRVKREK